MCTGRLCRHICVESVREVAPSAYLRTSGLVGGGYVSRISFGAGDPVSSGRAALGQCACGCVVYDYENACALRPAACPQLRSRFPSGPAQRSAATRRVTRVN